MVKGAQFLGFLEFSYKKEIINVYSKIVKS